MKELVKEMSARHTVYEKEVRETSTQQKVYEKEVREMKAQQMVYEQQIQAQQENYQSVLKVCTSPSSPFSSSLFSQSLFFTGKLLIL